MVKNSAYFEEFENEFIAGNKLSIEQAFKLFEAMWEEAVSLGIFPADNPLEGIEVDLRIAGILNYV